MAKPQNFPNRRPNNGNTAVSFQQASLFTGPVPPPETLKLYEEINPGFADRLIIMAEKEQEHRHDLNHRQIDQIHERHERELLINKRGQICAFGCVVLIIGLAAYCIYSGFPNYGVYIVAGALISLVTAFLRIRNYKPEKVQLPAVPEG